MNAIAAANVVRAHGAGFGVHPVCHACSDAPAAATSQIVAVAAAPAARPARAAAAAPRAAAQRSVSALSAAAAPRRAQRAVTCAAAGDFVGAAAAADAKKTNTVVDAAIANPDFSVLVEAVVKVRQPFRRVPFCAAAACARAARNPPRPATRRAQLPPCYEARGANMQARRPLRRWAAELAGATERLCGALFGRGSSSATPAAAFASARVLGCGHARPPPRRRSMRALCSAVPSDARPRRLLSSGQPGGRAVRPRPVHRVRAHQRGVRQGAGRAEAVQGAAAGPADAGQHPQVPRCGSARSLLYRLPF